MKVAVLTLTRDRLDYTKHCFARLRELAGCDYYHYVLDQGSTDGTPRWIEAEYKPRLDILLVENIGIARGMNWLTDVARDQGYDYLVGFDNDCELTTPGTLRTVCEASGGEWILSPRVDGLNNPQHHSDSPEVVNGHRVGPTGVMGNIFRCVPAAVYERGFRYNEKNPPWGGEETQICDWWARRGGKCGYMLDLPVNHYETTEGQKARYPEYWERKKQEMGICN